MYKVSKRMEIAGSHHLYLDYESKCKYLHGHNWIVTVHCKSRELDRNGMVVDFAKVKKAIHGKLDHGNLNAIFDFNPTAENIATWIAQQVTMLCLPSGGHCYKVEVQESEGNIAIYEEDN